MPTYEFRCPSGHEFQRFYKSISGSDSELPCPECGAVATRQVSGGAGLLFKGSGFYLTDYGKNAHRGGSSSGSTSSGGEKKADGGKPDSGKTPAASSGSEAKPAAAASPAKSESPKSTNKPKPE